MRKSSLGFVIIFIVISSAIWYLTDLRSDLKVQYPKTATVGEMVTFDASNSLGIQGVINWDMGDNSTYVGDQIEHFYKKPGEYTITIGYNGRSEKRRERYNIEIGDMEIEIKPRYAVDKASYDVRGLTVRSNPQGLFEVGGTFFTGGERVRVWSIETRIDNGKCEVTGYESNRETVHYDLEVGTVSESNVGRYILTGTMDARLERNNNTYTSSIRTRYHGLPGTGSDFGTDDETKTEMTYPAWFYAFDLPMINRGESIGLDSSGSFDKGGIDLYWRVVSGDNIRGSPCLKVEMIPDLGKEVESKYQFWLESQTPVPIKTTFYLSQMQEGNLTVINQTMTLDRYDIKEETTELIASPDTGPDMEVDEDELIGLDDHGLPLELGSNYLDPSIKPGKYLNLAINLSSGLKDYLGNNPESFVHSFTGNFHSTQKEWKIEVVISNPANDSAYHLIMNESEVIWEQVETSKEEHVEMNRKPVIPLQRIESKITNETILRNLLKNKELDYNNLSLSLSYRQAAGIPLELIIGGEIPAAVVYFNIPSILPNRYYEYRTSWENGYTEAIFDPYTGRTILAHRHKDIGSFVFP